MTDAESARGGVSVATWYGVDTKVLHPTEHTNDPPVVDTRARL